MRSERNTCENQDRVRGKRNDINRVKQPKRQGIFFSVGCRRIYATANRWMLRQEQWRH